MKHILYSLIFLIKILFSFSSYGQDNMMWIHYFNKFNLSYKYSIDSDIGYRNNFDDIKRWQFRSGLKYDIKESLNIRVGVMYVDGHRSNQELRFYQDILQKTKIGEVILSGRLRFEEQLFLQKNLNNNRVRFNPMAKLSTGLGLLSFGIEPFIQLSNFSISNNRWYLGITRYTKKNTLITIQYIRERNYSNSELNFVQSNHMIRIKIDHVINPLRLH
ncbi:DUF2490 domain-containing protein [Flammeovirga sp. SubArs3]|uniref:DUF2490 domain-containing protein n=1 Tax=Flammeovirga sp. SubArs3 TaxID=2995316 RepID=UPI00248CBEAC|nr:DUF2490 domain-containing protein [Flammeovirga sp. SubArs3]